VREQSRNGYPRSVQPTCSDEAIRIALPCGPVAPRIAREAIRRVLGTTQVGDDAALVVSELVTNAVQHSGCEPNQTITVDARVSGGCVRISVHDPGQSTETPTVLDHPITPSGGLGLRLVERLARRWGSDRPDGRLVWAELAL
jgi:anti-sigma regulatory factor (Ser/Thr protein kinase)